MAKAKPRAKAKPASGAEFRLREAALRIIARQGWERLTLEEVARAAKLPAAQAKQIFADKDALLPGIVRFIDAQMKKNLGAPDPRASLHDRVFEILMARFDVLQNHRRAITGIMDAAKRDPQMIRHLLPAQIKSMRGILDLAGLKADPLYGIFMLAGLMGIYGAGLCVWRRDSSPDMAKTMAALDRILRRAFALSDILPGGRFGL